MRPALGQRLRWREARLVEIRDETPTARTLLLDVPEWPGHAAGQHLDVRLTADDGYTAQRSYSIAAPAEGERIELTVQLLADGEVSPYLVQDFAVGDSIEVRGPVGGWFVWRPEDMTPVLLAAGGSGVVPLMAMVRARRLAGSRVPFRLIYSVRTPGDVYYAEELHRRIRDDQGLDVSLLYSRVAPEGWARPPARISPADLTSWGWPAELEPRSYICGSTGFVEAVANQLVDLGHDPQWIRTERYGASGG
jgi:ferredoxin-NADP reductase